MNDFLAETERLDNFVREASHNRIVKIINNQPVAIITNQFYDVPEIATLTINPKNSKNYILTVKGEEKEIEHDADILFRHLIAAFELHYLPIELLSVKALKYSLRANIKVDGEKFSNIDLGRVPNRNDVSITNINVEDENKKFIQLSSSLFKSKRTIFANKI